MKNSFVNLQRYVRLLIDVPLLLAYYDLWVLFQPYAAKIAQYLKAKHPNVPVVYFANGGSCFLQQQLDMGVDGLSVDWRVSMASARKVAGAGVCYDMITAI